MKAKYEIVEFNAVMQCNVWLTNLQVSSKCICTEKLKENLGHIFVSYF